MFWMAPGESSCPDGSEYVCQRGVGVFGAELRAAEVDPHFEKKMRICGVKKNKHGHNVQNIVSKTNQRWFITFDKALIHFGNDI